MIRSSKTQKPTGSFVWVMRMLTKIVVRGSSFCTEAMTAQEAKRAFVTVSLALAAVYGLVLKNKSTSALQRSTSPTENFDFPAISFFTSSHGACCGLCCAVLNRIAKPRWGLESCFLSLLRSPGYCCLAHATDSLDQALLRPPRLSSCLQRGVV